MIKPKPLLDIIIPVFNEAENIIPVLNSLKINVKTPFRVQICYDFEEDSTLPEVKNTILKINLKLF